MEPNIKFSDLKTLWTCKQMEIAPKVYITVWEDPTGQFVSLSPVVSVREFKNWWNRKLPFQQQIVQFEDVHEDKKPKRRVTHEDLTIESWFVAK